MMKGIGTAMSIKKLIGNVSVTNKEPEIHFESAKEYLRKMELIYPKSFITRFQIRSDINNVSENKNTK